MGAWIEIKEFAVLLDGVRRSHPTMGAWIEMDKAKKLIEQLIVAPHDGCVD